MAKTNLGGARPGSGRKAHLTGATNMTINLDVQAQAALEKWQQRYGISRAAAARLLISAGNAALTQQLLQREKDNP